MFAQRLRMLPIIVAIVFVVSLLIISGVGRSSPSASAASVHNLTITGISAAAGPITAGSTVTIKGTGFAAGARVVFDETDATDAKVVSDKEITATVPANVKKGSIDVTVFVGKEGEALSRDKDSQ